MGLERLQFGLITMIALACTAQIVHDVQSIVKEAGPNSANVFLASLETRVPQLFNPNPDLDVIQSAKKSVSIPLEQSDQALLLKATVDEVPNVKFLLDTGATYTTISRETAIRLGYDLNNSPKINITTANGQVSMPKIVLKSVTLNGYKVRNVEATVMNLPSGMPFSGLLGLNFVKKNKMTINTQANELVLEPHLM
jgi:clan AA aspartic protease (TIGR02281 family)